MKKYSLLGVGITALFFFSGMMNADDQGSANDQDSAKGKKKKRYDYIIVGGGSAGCILARKLSDNHQNSVLVIEAGGNEIHDPVVLDPNWLDNVAELTVNSKFAINYPLFFPPFTLASYSEGHSLGGGGTHNYMVAVDITPSVANTWAAITGNPIWSYSGNIRNLKRALEKYTPNETIANPVERGDRGLISITQSPPLDPTNPFLSALSTVTLTPFVPDYNDPSLGEIGISAVQQFMTAGAGSHRSFSALEYLSPVIDANGKGLNGRKLTVLTNANALDIRINSDMRATSVHYTIRNSEKPEVEYEIIKASLTKDTGILILSAGSVQTPKILLQSGVGPAADLEALGIPVVLDSPHVGQNLQCQLGGAAIVTGGTVPFEAEAFIDVYPYMPNDGVRRVQFIHIQVSPGVFEVLPVILDPKSRGSVTLASNNPFLQPNVNIALFSDGSVSTPGTDAYLQVSSYKIIQAAATLAGQTVVYPSQTQFASDDTLLAAAEAQLGIQSHIVGTAVMGTDISNSVVDGNLKVHGLANVYLMDNSIQPTSARGNTCEPAYIISEVGCQVLGVPIPPAA